MWPGIRERFRSRKKNVTWGETKCWTAVTTGVTTIITRKRSTKTAPARSARTNRTADGKTVAHEDEEMDSYSIEYKRWKQRNDRV